MLIHPYLFFTNTAHEAMTRYHEILGGELEVMRYADLPPGEEAPPFDDPGDLVMHASLRLDGGALIMASDDPGGDGSGVKGVAISLSLDDADEARRVFDALADGGEVEMPLGETFWSPLFGTCRDRFGVAWMVGLDHDGAS